MIGSAFTMHKAKQWILTCAAPEGSFRRHLLRKGENLIRKRSCPPQEIINVYDEKSFASFLSSCRAPLLTWSATGAVRSDLEAARLAMGVLQARPKLRRRFPSALTEGRQGGYCQWLCSAAAKQLGLSAPAIGNIRAAFSRRLAARPQKLFDYDANLAALMPMALTPLQLASFGRYLLEQGKSQHGLLDEEICWFLFERAEDPFAGIVATYLRTPQWQEQFPLGITAFGWREFLGFVKAQHGFDLDWLRCSEAPQTLHPIDQLRQLYNFTPELRSVARDGLPDRRDRQRIMQWIRKEGARNEFVDRKWQAGLEAGIADGTIDRLGINVLGPFCYPAGNGESIRVVADALKCAGMRTSCRNIPASPEIDRPHHGDFLGLEIFDYTLLLVAPEPDLKRSCNVSRLQPRDGVYRIAIWYWELETVPPELTRHGASFQEVWAGSRFVGRALRTSLSIPVIDMVPGVQLPSFAELPRSRFGLPDDRFLFLFMFDMCSVMERKNPLALIRAYQQAFRNGEAVSLAIKVSRGESNKKDFSRLKSAADEAGVRIIDGIFAREEVCALMNCCDCYTSLHRSEGFGQTMAEAMLMGKPVIATGYSGNLDFMSSSNSLLVDYERVPIAQDLPYYKKGELWAEPSVAHAAEYMRWVYDHQEEARVFGLQAQSETRALLSLEAAGERMAQRLRQLEAEGAVGRARAGAA
jgi:glycosyltransferase involved in cell wall biosynthesis